MHDFLRKAHQVHLSRAGRTIADSTFDNCITVPYTIVKGNIDAMVKHSTEVTEDTGGKTGMQYFLSLLPLLACPVGMGLIMWFMMRGNKGSASRDADQVPISSSSRPLEVVESPEGTHESPQRTSLFKMLFLCLNWKVVAGLAVVALAVLVLVPQYLWVALPLLLVAACPLSMLFMMRGMHGEGSGTTSQLAQVGQPSPLELTHNEQVAELKARLSGVQAEQDAIARQIAELETPKPSIIYEAESVAPVTNKRSGTPSTPAW